MKKIRYIILCVLAYSSMSFADTATYEMVNGPQSRQDFIFQSTNLAGGRIEVKVTIAPHLHQMSAFYPTHLQPVV